MGLTYNGETPSAIMWGSNVVKKVIYDGVTVWSTLSGAWEHAAYASRPWNPRESIQCTGTAIGSASGGGYKYKISVPIFHSTNNTNSYSFKIWLGASSGAQTIDCGSFSITESTVITATVTSDTWLGNSASIWMYVDFVFGQSASFLTVNSGKKIKVTAEA